MNYKITYLLFEKKSYLTSSWKMAAVQYTVANQPFLIVRQKSQIQFQTIKLSTTSCRVGCSRN